MMSPCSWLALFVLVFAMSVNGLENMTVEDIVHGHRNHRVKGPHRWDASHNYRDALSKSILFFEGQRSGRLPPNQRLNWRGDSALADGATAHVDLVGGYYDAGDNVKFGFPMAFTTTMLSWSILEFGGLMGGELSNAKAAIRWATDYLLKATVHPNTIYVQVGDAAKDHQCWERPEDMDTVRTVLKVDPSTPGTEVASETAAALAAASLIFRKSDKAYSKVLLRRAIMVFNFANRYRGSYTGSSLRRSICPYYCSFSGYQDELLWGAAWLHKATRKSWYLYFLNSNAANFGAYASDSVFGWDDKHAGVRVLLSKEFLINKVKSVEEYRQHADFSICSLIPGNSYSSAKYTRGGLLYRMTDTNLQYVTSASFLLFTYAKYLSASRQRISCGSGVVTPHTLRAIAKRQVDYILGENPEGMSYMVGYGKKYPMRVHHRGSSLPSKRSHPQKIACGEGFQAMSSSAPNPNVLVGAIVGGPDQNDLFKDQRSDFMQSEPATYINAPFVGSLAYLSHSTSH